MYVYFFGLCRYQLQVFEVAKKRNTIAVLETGAGKTMVPVMLIKAIGEAIKSNGHKKLIVFLAPIVHLVNQAWLFLFMKKLFPFCSFFNSFCPLMKYFSSIVEWKENFLVLIKYTCEPTCNVATWFIHILKQMGFLSAAIWVYKNHTNMEVGQYYGDMGVDNWSLEIWEREVNKNDVRLLLK